MLDKSSVQIGDICVQKVLCMKWSIEEIVRIGKSTSKLLPNK